MSRRRGGLYQPSSPCRIGEREGESAGESEGERNEERTTDVEELLDVILVANHGSELRFDDIAELESRELLVKGLAVEEMCFPVEIKAKSGSKNETKERRSARKRTSRLHQEED